MMPSRLRGCGSFISVGLLLCGLNAPARGLEPNELLLVCNADVPASRELAAYYAKVRRVPASQICALKFSEQMDEDISAEGYDQQIRQPIRAFLNERKLIPSIRCLVTFYGLPIRVREMRSTPEKQAAAKEFERRMIESLGELEKFSAQIDSVGTTKKLMPARLPKAEDYISILRRYVQVKKDAIERLGKIKDPAQHADAYRQLVPLIQESEGAAGIIAQIQISGGDPDDEPHRQFTRMKENVQQAEREIAAALLLRVGDPKRDAIAPLIRQYHGVIGLLSILNNDLLFLRTQETTASVDSELTLLWYEDYPRTRWFPNLLSWPNRLSQEVRQQVSPGFWHTRVMMVSRLDASSPKVVKRMIDDSLAAEAKGLEGKIYLDARGKYNPASYAQYDGSLRDLELLIKRNTPLTVILDNKESLFAPHACPDTMLYCGWYSLRHYIDSFTFVPGAVAYHIASFEAESLHVQSEQGWVKNLLDHGAAATIGPVAEPYLHSFPLPKEFFGLLLTGRFTLAECYAYTSNLSSWMQMLLGDPLYKPFAKKPYLKIDQVIPIDRIPSEFRPGSTMPATDPASMPSTESAP